jgi:glycosyltransferase involved in cell wall biosynthesis
MCPAGLGIQDAAPLVVFAGRLEAQKNIEKMFEALDAATERTGARALLFGSGSLEGDVLDFIRARGADDRIRLMGFRADVWNWIKCADVFVSVSLYEGMPNTVMEAMALGCPVVVSRIGPHSEILDEGCAYFVPTDDAGVIANGIVTAIEARAESAARAECARNRAAQWSVEAVVQAYAAIYRELDSSLSAGQPK